MNEKPEKKYQNKEWDQTSFFIPITFRKFWNLINKLSEIDFNNPQIKEYAEKVEKVDTSNFQRGKRGLYVRWVLFEHVKKNAHKLMPKP